MDLTLPRNEVLVLSSKRAGLQRPQDCPPQEGPSPTFALIASFRWASTSSADSGGLREVSALPPHQILWDPQKDQVPDLPSKLSCLPQNSGWGAASGIHPLQLELPPRCTPRLKALTVKGRHEEVQCLAVEG